MAEDGYQNRKKPQFGTRYLTDQKDAYKHNAWDDVEWSEDLKRKAEEKIKENSLVKVSTEEQAKYECEANIFWNKFYTIHENKFFKDRHWLFTEFPELSLQPSSQRTNILEVGCGVGNTVFPILETNIGSDVFVYCCDFSEVAVSIIQSHPSFDAERCCPFVCDISSEAWKVPFEECSLDFIIFVFVLSAIHPDKMQGAVKTLSKYLKPGGSILFRDYGRYDLVELRFKPGRCLSEHFYVRGDGTRVYFFSEEEVSHLFSTAGLVQTQLYSSKRLQVNRGKHIQMYRIWIQAKYKKPL